MGCFKVFAKSWDEMTNEQDPSRSICNFSSNSPNSVSTLRGSYSRSKGRCLIRVLQLGRGIFPVNFCTKWLLWNDLTCILTAQARTKSVSAFWAQSGARHFSCKFRSKVALLNFWLAFRLRRLAQSLCVCVSAFWTQFGARHFSWTIRIKLPLWNLTVHFDCQALACPVARVIYAICCFGSQSLSSNRLALQLLFSQNRIYMHKVVWNVSVNKQTHL